MTKLCLVLVLALFMTTPALAEAPALNDTGPGGIVFHADPRPPAPPRAIAREGAPASPGLPTEWCGSPTTSDRPDTGYGPSIKVVYVHTDDIDRFGYFATLLQANVAWMTRFFATQSDYRKTLRFDMGTTCGPDFIDLEELHLPGKRDDYLYGPTAEYPATRWPWIGQEKLWPFISAIVNRGIEGARPRHNYLFYLDGFNIEYDLIGGEWKTSNYRADWGAAAVYPDSVKDPAKNTNVTTPMYAQVFGSTPEAWPETGGYPVDDPSAGFQPSMPLHEVIHTLGAVLPGAPSSTPGLHCTDGQDVMCYRDSADPTSVQRDVCAPLAFGPFTQSIDCGRDSYFSPDPAPGSWLADHWNTYDSPLLAPCSEMPRACGLELAPNRAPWGHLRVGRARVAAVAHDDHGVARVELLVDGRRRGTRGRDPYVFKRPRGRHRLQLRLTDSDGVSARSPLVWVR